VECGFAVQLVSIVDTIVTDIARRAVRSATAELIAKVCLLAAEKNIANPGRPVGFLHTLNVVLLMVNKVNNHSQLASVDLRSDDLAFAVSCSKKTSTRKSKYPRGPLAYKRGQH